MNLVTTESKTAAWLEYYRAHWPPEPHTVRHTTFQFGAEPTIEAVDAILGYTAWRTLRCSECEQIVERIVKLESSFAAQICRACLVKALVMIDGGK